MQTLGTGHFDSGAVHARMLLRSIVLIRPELVGKDAAECFFTIHGVFGHGLLELQNGINWKSRRGEENWGRRGGGRLGTIERKSGVMKGHGHVGVGACDGRRSEGRDTVSAGAYKGKRGGGRT
jgi:hypothetical protein